MATTIIDTFITRYAFQVDRQSARRVNTFVSGLQTRVRALGGALSTLGVAGGLGIAGITQALREYSRVTNAIQNNLLNLTKKQGEAVSDAKKGLKEYEAGLVGIDRTIKRVFTTTQHLEGVAALMSGDRSSATQINKMYKSAALPTAISESVTPAQAGASLTNILRAYGLQDTAEQMKHVADVIASFATKHAIPFASMDRILSGLGERSQNAGVSLREMAGILTYLGSEGLDPSRIDTALRAVLSRLLTIETQSPAVKERLNRAGISTDDIKRNYFGEGGKGLLALLYEFRDKNVDSSTLRALMGEEAYVIFGEMVSDVGKLSRVIWESQRYGGGAADKRAQVMSSGLGPSISGITSSLQELAVAIGNTGVIEGLTLFADGVAYVTNFLSTIIGGLGETIRNSLWAAGFTGLAGLGLWSLRGKVKTGYLFARGRSRATDAIARELSNETSTLLRRQQHELMGMRVGQDQRSKIITGQRKKRQLIWHDRIKKESSLAWLTPQQQERRRYKLWRMVLRTPGINLGAPIRTTRGSSADDRSLSGTVHVPSRLQQARAYMFDKQVVNMLDGRDRRSKIYEKGVKGLDRLGKVSRLSRSVGWYLKFLLGQWGLLLTLGIELIPLLINNWRSIVEFFKSPIQNLSRWFDSLSGLQNPGPLKTAEQEKKEKEMRENYMYYDQWKKNMERMGIDRPSEGDRSASLNVNIGDIHVATAAGASGEDIATGIRTNLVNQLHSAIENFDNAVSV